MLRLVILFRMMRKKMFRHSRKLHWEKTCTFAQAMNVPTMLPTRVVKMNLMTAVMKAVETRAVVKMHKPVSEVEMKMQKSFSRSYHGTSPAFLEPRN